MAVHYFCYTFTMICNWIGMNFISGYHVLPLLLVSKCVLGENFHLMRYAGQRLAVTYNTLLTVSPIHCNALCKRESSCRSVNYNTITGECQPSEICHGDIAGNTVTDPDWDVFTLKGIVILKANAFVKFVFIKLL